MLKYLVFVLTFWGYNSGYVLAEQDTIRILTRRLPSDTTQHNCSETAEKFNITMNGHSNYHVGQQIIHVYGQQQFKRMFDNNLMEKSVGEDYFITSGIGAHKFHLRLLTWNKARRTCIQEGGQLAIINSFSEEKILLHMMQEKNITQAWLGIHDLYEEGDWVTVKGEPLESTGYIGWTTKIANAQPDNAGGEEHCATLIIEGGMNDNKCNRELPFFCEISL